MENFDVPVAAAELVLAEFPQNGKVRFFELTGSFAAAS
jgi:hypothetical protein